MSSISNVIGHSLMGTNNSNQGCRPEGGLPWVFLCQSQFGCHDTCVKAWCNKSLVPKLICCHSLYICHCLYPTQQLWSTRKQWWQAINWTMQIIPDVTIRYTVALNVYKTALLYPVDLRLDLLRTPLNISIFDSPVLVLNPRTLNPLSQMT